MKPYLFKVKQYLLSGVSYAIPFVACGGILIAVAVAFAPMGPTGPDFTHHPNLKLLLDIGAAAFSLLVPVLSGYIAFGMADRPGLVPGFVAGFLANQVNAGFLGGLIGGLLAGFLAMWLKKIKVPPYLRPVMPILVIPVFASLGVGLVMLLVNGDLVIAAASTKAYEELVRARVQEAEQCPVPPTLVSGRLYCRTGKGALRCLDVAP